MGKADIILDEIIAATLARHADLSQEDYCRELGIEEGKEKEAKFTLMSACTKEVINMAQKLKLVSETINVIKGEGENE